MANHDRRRKALLRMFLLMIPVMLRAVDSGDLDHLSDERLDQLKSATVFVTTPSGTGSGFLVRVDDGATGFLVTNHHVIVDMQSEISEEISCVFHSGRPGEMVLEAEVVAQVELNDLAILRVESGQLPEPIQLVPIEQLRETMPVFLLGFPFGASLNRDRRYPELTMGRGVISSLRYDYDDMLQLVQLDGDINPGNSGGPVVTADGRLVGVAVSTVTGTDVSFAITPDRVSHLIRGYVTATTLTLVEISQFEALYTMEIGLADPTDNIVRIAASMMPLTDIGRFPAFDPERMGFPMMGEREHWTEYDVENGEVAFDIEVEGHGRDEYFAIQFAYQTRDGEWRYLAPSVETVPFRSVPEEIRRRRQQGR